MNRFFSPHIELAHKYWKNLLRSNDFVIDMTCGNGHDTLYLAQLGCEVLGLDIQEIALIHTQKRLEDHHIPLNQVKLLLQSHADPISFQSPPRLIVYNLGYLPSGDKAIVTKTKDTIKSLEQAIQILDPTGAISITCYPGHEEGFWEEKEILNFLKSLSSKEWSICYHQWINRDRSPTLLFLEKKIQKPHAPPKIFPV